MSQTVTMTNNINGTAAGLNIVDNINSVGTQNCAFAYDDLQRLMSQNCGSKWGAAYSYDPLGNINKTTIAGSPGTTFQANYNTTTNRFSTIGSTTPTYDANGNLTFDGFHNYGWDAEGNLITVDGSTGTFDALGRRVELGSGFSYDLMVYPPFAPNYQLALANVVGSTPTAVGIRFPLPGGGEAVFNSGGLAQYRHPNWQGSQVVMSYPSDSPSANVGGAFTAFGEKYALYPGGGNGFFAGMLGIADAGPISDAYQSQTRLYHQAEGRWVSPDPAGMGAVDLSNPQTLNRYAYVANDPLDQIDPSGLDGDYSAKNGICPPGTVPGPNGDGCKPANVSPSTNSASLDICGTLLGLFPFAAIPGCNSSFVITVTAAGQNGNGRTTAAPNNPYKMITCAGVGRGLAGNTRLVGRQGGIPGQTVQLNTAAVTPTQFNVPNGGALSPFAPYINGTVGNARFTSITDVNGGKSPIPGVPVRLALQQLFPGQLILEIPGAKDQGANAPVSISVPRSLGCPAGTHP